MRERPGKKSVRYTTVHFTKLAHIGQDELKRAVRAVATVLRETANRLVQHTDCVLVVCLGNPHITPDSLGHCTAGALNVTRHVQLLDSRLFSRFGKSALCLVEPGVLGNTGVEAAEIVRGTVREVGAELVVVVDALTASCSDHLFATVQIGDGGLQPGSGMDARVRRVPIVQSRVGCPVISLGIPTVIDSATLICDALFRAGICGVGDALSQHLDKIGGYAVSPVNADLLVSRGGMLLAGAIEECFGIGADAPYPAWHNRAGSLI